MQGLSKTYPLTIDESKRPIALSVVHGRTCRVERRLHDSVHAGSGEERHTCCDRASATTQLSPGSSKHRRLSEIRPAHGCGRARARSLRCSTPRSPCNGRSWSGVSRRWRNFSELCGRWINSIFLLYNSEVTAFRQPALRPATSVDKALEFVRAQPFTRRHRHAEGSGRAVAVGDCARHLHRCSLRTVDPTQGRRSETRRSRAWYASKTEPHDYVFGV